MSCDLIVSLLLSSLKQVASGFELAPQRFRLTQKRGQSRVSVSYSPPSPQTLIPYLLIGHKKTERLKAMYIDQKTDSSIRLENHEKQTCRKGYSAKIRFMFSSFYIWKLLSN